ncbi:hypothetical protein [Paenibacillus typhae]|uniref:hypothetical protein n=1 Tax=Paenibacillus typhae TaxID=1174501 RepID=UPI001C8E33DF|nr:hypothetical protein [Paenibacillus typhae]MBY0010800.1 hypothetical protein [Paenibacillus typhae]
MEKGSARISNDQLAKIPESKDIIEGEYTYGLNITNDTGSENVQAEQSGFGYIYIKLAVIMQPTFLFNTKRKGTQ